MKKVSIILFIDNNGRCFYSKKTKIFCTFPGSSSFTTPQFNLPVTFSSHSISPRCLTPLSPSIISSPHSYLSPAPSLTSLISPQNISIYHNCHNSHFLHSYSFSTSSSSSHKYIYFIHFIKYSNYRSYITYT